MRNDKADCPLDPANLWWNCEGNLYAGKPTASFLRQIATLREVDELRERLDKLEAASRLPHVLPEVSIDFANESAEEIAAKRKAFDAEVASATFNYAPDKFSLKAHQTAAREAVRDAGGRSAADVLAQVDAAADTIRMLEEMNYALHADVEVRDREREKLNAKLANMISREEHDAIVAAKDATIAKAERHSISHDREIQFLEGQITDLVAYADDFNRDSEGHLIRVHSNYTDQLRSAYAEIADLRAQLRLARKDGGV